MDLSNTEANRILACDSIISRTLEFFVLECLLRLSNEQRYTRHVEVIHKFVEDHLNVLLRIGEQLKTSYDCDFNDRTSLVCFNQDPYCPALVMGSPSQPISDLSFSFYENLMLTKNNTFISESKLSGGVVDLRQWKNANPHFKLVSNITGLVRRIDGTMLQRQIAFLLDSSKLFYSSALDDRCFEAQSEIMKLLDLDNLPLLNRVDNHFLSPNLKQWLSCGRHGN